MTESCSVCLFRRRVFSCWEPVRLSCRVPSRPVSAISRLLCLLDVQGEQRKKLSVSRLIGNGQDQ